MKECLGSSSAARAMIRRPIPKRGSRFSCKLFVLHLLWDTMIVEFKITVEFVPMLQPLRDFLLINMYFWKRLSEKGGIFSSYTSRDPLSVHNCAVLSLISPKKRTILFSTYWADSSRYTMTILFARPTYSSTLIMSNITVPCATWLQCMTIVLARLQFFIIHTKTLSRQSATVSKNTVSYRTLASNYSTQSLWLQ